MFSCSCGVRDFFKDISDKIAKRKKKIMKIFFKKHVTFKRPQSQSSTNPQNYTTDDSDDDDCISDDDDNQRRDDYLGSLIGRQRL